MTRTAQEYKHLHTVDADGIKVEYEVELPQITNDYERMRAQFYDDYHMTLNELERLTNHAEGLDYALAASSGVIAGLIDVFFVGELGIFKDASEAAKNAFQVDKGHVHEKMNRYIEYYAKGKGYDGRKGLTGAIEFMEKKYPVLQDNVWSGKGISSTKTHHLDDLAHHPTLLGLLSAIMVQYLRLSTFAGKDGKVTFLLVETDKKELIKIFAPVVLSGFLKWIIYMAEREDVVEIDDLPKPIQILIRKIHLIPVIIPLLKVVDNWYGHLVSDMGGSKNTPGGGTGISGIFLSFFKEISMLPGIDKSSLPQVLNNLYQGTKNSPLTDKLDLRTEVTFLKKQMLPVIINEVLVRTSFMIHHLIKELQTNDIQHLHWNSVIPFYNRSIVRLMTISTGTMEAIDIADAAIRATLKSGGTLPGFAIQFCLRINFVGIGRFGIACATDVAMGIKKERLEYAAASAEVAIAADRTDEVIDEINSIKKATEKRIEELKQQTNGLENLQF